MISPRVTGVKGKIIELLFWKDLDVDFRKAGFWQRD